MTWRRIRLVMWKEVRQLRRDPALVRVLIFMPILQLMLFGYVVAADVTDVPTYLVDLDRTATSRQIIARFEASPYFQTVIGDSEADMRAVLDRGDAQVGVVIPEGTQRTLQAGRSAPIGIVVDGAAQSSNVGAGYTQQVLAQFNQGLHAQVRMLGQPNLDAVVRVMYNPTLRMVNTMVPALVASILMIAVMVVLSQSVVRERESGTLEQIFISPITRDEYLIGKVVPYLAVASVQSAIVVLAGTLWFQVPFSGSVLVVIVGLVLFMLTCAGLGLLVSLNSTSRTQAQQTVIYIVIPMIILSGFIFPIDSMPAVMQPVSRILPLTYALEILRGAYVKGTGFEALGQPLMALALFAAVIFGVAVITMRRRLT